MISFMAFVLYTPSPPTNITLSTAHIYIERAQLIFNSYYPDIGEWIEGQAYAARGRSYPYDVLYLHFKINSY